MNRTSYWCTPRCSLWVSALLHTQLMTAGGPKLALTRLTAACACRYDKILSRLLQLLSLRHELPAALLEHVVTESMVGSPGGLPAESRRFVAKPGRGAETIDLLICAASAGSVRTVQLLIDRGAPSAHLLWQWP